MDIGAPVLAASRQRCLEAMQRLHEIKGRLPIWIEAWMADAESVGQCRRMVDAEAGYDFARRLVDLDVGRFRRADGAHSAISGWSDGKLLIRAQKRNR